MNVLKVDFYLQLEKNGECSDCVLGHFSHPLHSNTLLKAFLSNIQKKLQSVKMQSSCNNINKKYNVNNGIG